MDASRQVRGDILLQAGTHHDTVRLRFEDWLKLINPRVDAFSEPVEPSRELGSRCSRQGRRRSTRGFGIRSRIMPCVVAVKQSCFTCLLREPPHQHSTAPSHPRTP